jgi:hypothetical protein
MPSPPSRARITSVYRGEHLDAVLASGAPAGRSVSARIDLMAERYRQMVYRNRPGHWTKGQWALAVLAARTLVGARGTEIRLLSELVRELVNDEQDKAVGCDGSGMIYTTNSLRREELIAVIDVAERYWAQYDTLDPDRVQQLIEQPAPDSALVTRSGGNDRT